MAISKKDVLVKVEDIHSLVAELYEGRLSRAHKFHLAAVSSLNHANSCGDLTLLTAVVSAFGPNENVREFMYWVKVFSGGLIVYKGNQFKSTRADKDDKDIDPVKGNVPIDAKYQDKFKDAEGNWQTREVTALTCAWWELGKVNENRNKAFDPAKDVKSVISFLTRHADEADKAEQFELAEAYRTLKGRMMVEYENAVNLAKRRSRDKVEAE